MIEQYAHHLAEIRSDMEVACERCGRQLGDVTLVAVSKNFDASVVQKVVSCGQRVFGENRCQEAEDKIARLPKDLEWHFIGQLQRNKVRRVLPLVKLIHSVDSLKLALHINHVAAELGLEAQVLLQLNLAAEKTKAGFSEQQLMSDWRELFRCSSLNIMGLMTVPPPVPDPEMNRPWFALLRRIQQNLAELSNRDLPFLSMGMSHDFAVAIEEGATHVRIGSRLFGDR